MSEPNQASVFASALATLKEGPEFQLGPGPNPLRILPVMKLDGTKRTEFWETIVVHWNVGPNRRLVRCLRAEGQPCYVCEYAKQLEAAGHKQPASQLSASNRFLMGIIPLNSAKPEPKVTAVGPQILEGILTVAMDPSWGDPADAVQGYPVTVTKSGQGLGTKYTTQPGRERMPAKEDWLANLPNLKEHYRLYSYQEQQMIVAGQDPSQVGGGAPGMVPVPGMGGAPAYGGYVSPPPMGGTMALPSAPTPLSVPTVGAAPPPMLGTSSVAAPMAPPTAPNPAASGSPNSTTVVTGGEDPKVAEVETPPFADAPPSA
jgi:hypothetical protein